MATKIAILTDVHLGQRGADDSAVPEGQDTAFRQESLLSIPRSGGGGHRRSAWVAAQLAALARDDAADTAEPVHLVVTGDLLDLSLATIDDALEDLGHLLARCEAIHEVTYVVGNHDHHLWMLHSEHQRVLAPLQRGQLPGRHPYLPTPRLAPEPVRFLEPYLEAATGRPVIFRLAYPSFQLSLDDVDERGAPCQTPVYFTHGHLFGGLYDFMSDLLATELTGRDDAERVASTVNAPVIELIYWLLGETGEGMGADGVLEQVYTDLQMGQQSRIDRILTGALERLLPEGLIPGIPDRFERRVLARAAHWLINHVIEEQSPLHGSSRDRFRPEEVTRRALAAWVTKVGLPLDRRMLLFHGHTHKADRHGVSGTRIQAFNLGSWLLEPGAGPPHAYLTTLHARPGHPLEVRCTYGGSDLGEEPDNKPVMTRAWSWQEAEAEQAQLEAAEADAAAAAAGGRAS